MPREIEARFLNVDPIEMRQQLSMLGFSCIQPVYLMRRVVFDIPGAGKSVWARVRDEDSKITITYKRTHDEQRIDGTEEIEITCNDFDDACRLLSSFGLVRKSYQETRREVWRSQDIDVSIDEWPALQPFLEIESTDENKVKKTAQDLGFDWKNALFGAVGRVYASIGIPEKSVNEFPLITFDNIDQLLALRE